MEKLLVLDLETVPDLEAGRVLLGEAADGLDGAGLRAALGHRTAREGQDPATVFLKPVLHRICAMGVLRAERDSAEAPWRIVSLKARTTDEMDEAEMLRRLEQLLRAQPVLVGFNSSGFDLPVLRYRALALGVPMPALLGPEGRDYTYRYGTAHIDLCERLSGYRATPPPSLAEACALLGITVKTGMNGVEVEPAMATGRGAEVAAYCERDVAATYLLWLRWMQVMGAQGVAEDLSALADFADTMPHLADIAAAAGRLSGASPPG